jgi:hypothetical protein
MSTLFFGDDRRTPVPTRFIRPTGCDGQRMWGTAWSTALGAEIEVRAWLPKNLEPECALEAARNGGLVLIAGDRLGWSRG